MSETGTDDDINDLVELRLDDLQEGDPDSIQGSGTPLPVADLQPAQPDTIKKNEEPPQYETKTQQTDSNDT